MTRLWVMSDLHLESHRDGGRAFIESLEPPECDALVLAGDILSLKDFETARRLLEAFARKAPRLLFVPGNHEYYLTSPEQAEAVLAELERALPTLDVLRAGRVVELHGGQRVLGDTMWFEHSDSWRQWRRYLMDFRTIEGFEPWVYERHAAWVRFAQSELRRGDVVVTHHLPSQRSVHPKFADSPLNPFFVSDRSSLIAERQPALWIHGHTHERVDVHVGQTRIVANPHGYLREERDTRFDEALVVEV